MKTMKTFIYILLGLISVEINAQCWQSISAGNNHILAVKNDGTLWAWGSNNYGKCGPSSQNYTNTPTQVGSENNWLKASTATYHSMALKTNGNLHGWGFNYFGNIGIGTSGLNNSIIPFSSQIGNSNWTNIACGNDFTIAINSNGTLWGWGDNSQGQLGDGTTILKAIPIQIGTSNNWQKIATGYYKGYGIKLDGTLWTWGINFLTQIGTSNDWQIITKDYAIKNNGSLWDISNVPYQIGSDTNWISISKNYQGNHQLALKSDGTLWSWGENAQGQLGDGTNINKTAPVQIGTNSNWNFISAGEKYSLALNSNGQLWAWGLNSNGQLGDGSFTNKNTPTLINCSTALELNDINFDNYLKIYPNPANKLIKIDTKSIESINRIYILNITGQRISEYEKNTTEINIEKLENGIYFILIDSEKGNYTSKFIKN